MTKTEELINEVLKLDAEATKGDWYWYATSPSTRSVLSKVGSRSEIISSGSYNPDAELIAAYRTAAPILAKVVRELVRQRDNYMCDLLLESNSSQFPSDVKEKDDAELDRIVAEGLGEK